AQHPVRPRRASPRLVAQVYHRDDAGAPAPHSHVDTGRRVDPAVDEQAVPEPDGLVEAGYRAAGHHGAVQREKVFLRTAAEGNSAASAEIDGDEPERAHGPLVAQQAPHTIAPRAEEAA